MREPSTPHRPRLWLSLILAIAMLGGAGGAGAVEIGQPAPDFNLDATTGGKISLSQFRGKQAVLIEFYGADFAPV
jgi:AhpC/TSA family